MNGSYSHIINPKAELEYRANRVTVRYQISAPEEVRKMLKIKDGQTVVFIEGNGKVVLKAEF